MYDTKDPTYYDRVRREVLPLLPAAADRLLDIGCGEGATAAYLKKQGLCRWAAGVESFPEAARIAASRLDRLVEGDVEAMDLPFDAGSIDLILCLDVLEHLVDPWATLRKVAALLAPGGTLVASIPNVRSLKVLGPLVFLGRWDYREEGILDRTHLRFFTRASAVRLIESAGLTIRRIEPYHGRYARILNTATLTLFSEFLATQHMIAATRTAA